MGKIIELGEMYLAKNYKREGLVFVKGKGTRLFTEEGEEYLDLTSGIAVCNLGHSHPLLVEEIKKQAELLWHTSNLYWTEPQVLLAEKLCQLSFAERVFFANSGAEAIEASLKLARRWAYENFGKKKREIIALKNSFHGRTFGALSITGQPHYWEGFEPLLPEIKFVSPNNIKELEETISEKTCALVLEPIQGEGGIIPLEKSFLESARELCNKHKVLLVFDEIQTGIGRTGSLFAYEHFGIEPDVMCLAKALANGLPISAVLAKEDIFSALKPGTHASTFGGNPIACRVGVKVLEIVSEKTFLEEVSLKGKVLKEKLEKYAEKFKDVIKEVRGLGLLIGIEFFQKEIAGKVYKEFLKRKILITMPKPYVIRLSPPLIINWREIDFFVENFEDVLYNIIK